MPKNRKNSIIGIIAIAINILAIAYKGVLGMRAGWETHMPIVIIGLVVSIITVVVKRNALAWISLVTAAGSVAYFFL